MTDLVADESGERLDVFIARRLPELTRSRVKKLIEEGCVTVARGQAKASMRLDRDDIVSVDVPAARDAIAQPEAIPIDVLYEDSDLLVLNKPAGMTEADEG